LHPDALETAAPAVVENYKVYREAVGDQELPPLNNPVGAWKLVQPARFDFLAHEGITTASFFLLAECD
jgi:hypothetical protein